MVVGWDGSTEGIPGATVFAPGDTVTIIVEAQDDTGLQWIGIEFLTPSVVADSIAIPDSIRAVRLVGRLETSAASSGIIALRAFARDRRSRTTAAVAGSPISLYATVDRPYSSTSLPAAVRDVAVDIKRNRLYATHPGLREISVIDLGTGAALAPLTPPADPRGLDVTAGTDSLIVTLPALRALGVYDFNAASGWQTIGLAFDTSLGRYPDNLRVTAHGRVLVSITATNYTGSVGQVVAYDLAAGTQRIRTDVSFDGYAGVVTDATLIRRSTDHSRLVFLFDNACCPERAQVYLSHTDTFLPRQETIQRYGPAVSLDATGSHTLVGYTVFDSTLANHVTLVPPGGAWASSLTPNADTAFFGHPRGFFRTRLADGVTLELVRLPQEPSRLYSVPGPGSRVLATAGTTLFIVDLGTPPAAVAQGSLTGTITFLPDSILRRP
jgi:hypothetical protein